MWSPSLFILMYPSNFRFEAACLLNPNVTLTHIKSVIFGLKIHNIPTDLFYCRQIINAIPCSLPLVKPTLSYHTLPLDKNMDHIYQNICQMQSLLNDNDVASRDSQEYDNGPRSFIAAKRKKNIVITCCTYPKLYYKPACQVWYQD